MHRRRRRPRCRLKAIPGLDITPVLPPGRQLIESYGAGKFRVAGRDHHGSVLIFPDYTKPWPVTELFNITLDTLTDLRSGPQVDILVVGCGPTFQAPPTLLRDGLRSLGVVLEWMDTGAACRTFNVLLGEDRACAAALIAVE
ncbi:MAG: Mth938-like domain-containing protein [Proteobacteria bacterium]|nr:Mth938-like domain-containing protein [Pseudomonadota bacterium]